MTPTPHPRSFVDGLGTGIAACALLILLYGCVEAGSFADMYRDIGDPAGLPLSTRIVLHPAWRVGAPGCVIALGAWGLARRPRSRDVMIAVAVLAVIAVIATYVALYRPIWMLAAPISAE